MHRKLIDGYYAPLRRASHRLSRSLHTFALIFRLRSPSTTDLAMGKVPLIFVYRSLQPSFRIRSFRSSRSLLGCVMPFSGEPDIVIPGRQIFFRGLGVVLGCSVNNDSVGYLVSKEIGVCGYIYPQNVAMRYCILCLVLTLCHRLVCYLHKACFHNIVNRVLMLFNI